MACTNHRASENKSLISMMGELQGSSRRAMLARPPPGFVPPTSAAREYSDEQPVYGQLDAGAIWTRTFNEFVTRQGPPASTGTSSSHAAEIEVAQALVCMQGRKPTATRAINYVPLKTHGVGGAAGHDWICP